MSKATQDAINEMRAEIAKLTTVAEGVKALVFKMADEVDAVADDDPEEIRALTAELRKQVDVITVAVEKNTVPAAAPGNVPGPGGAAGAGGKTEPPESLEGARPDFEPEPGEGPNVPTPGSVVGGPVPEIGEFDPNAVPAEPMPDPAKSVDAPKPGEPEGAVIGEPLDAGEGAEDPNADEIDEEEEEVDPDVAEDEAIKP